MLKAPWTDKQVLNLTKRQHNVSLHPYTCGDCGEVLIPTNTGWVCGTSGCNYTQDWCHKADADYHHAYIIDKDRVNEWMNNILKEDK